MRLKEFKNYNYIFVAVILSIIFFYPAIISGKAFWFRDIHKWFYPMKYFLATSLKSGHIPFWCPNLCCGSPFMSDIQSGVFYPLSLLFIPFPFPWSFNFYIIIHFILGFCFFYLFIKGIGLSRESALITSISYCYGSYAIASINTLNNLSTMIWLPAILWSFQRAKLSGHKSGLFFTVLFLCMAILGGEPQLFILSTGMLLFFALFFSHRESFRIRLIIKDTTVILLLVTSTFLITLVQLWPTYLDYHHSIRLGGISYEEATGWSLHIKMLKHFIIPLRFHTDFAADPATLTGFFPGNGKVPWLLTIYPGFMIAPLAFLGLFFNFSKKTLFWAVVFFITLILALGNNTPVYYIFYKIFPFFRYPVKIFFLTGFSLLVLSSYGLERLFSLFKRKGVIFNVIFFSIALILAIDLYTTHRNMNPLTDPAFYQYHHPSLKPLLNDQGNFRIYLHRESLAPAPLQETILNRHVRFQMFLFPNLGILHNLNHASGTSPLELRYQYLIAEILIKKPWDEKLRFLKLANTKYIITSQRLDRIPEVREQIEKINAFVYEIKEYLPRAWIVGQLQPIRKGTVDELVDSSFNPASSALAKGKIVERYHEPYFKKIDHIKYEDDNRIHIELTAESPGILVVSESSYPGWKVFVNGQEKECLWLNLLFQGVEIEKGKHEIDFVYRPKYFGVFLLISLSSLALFFLSWFFYRFFVKKRTIS